MSLTELRLDFWTAIGILRILPRLAKLTSRAILWGARSGKEIEDLLETPLFQQEWEAISRETSEWVMVRMGGIPGELPRRERPGGTMTQTPRWTGLLTQCVAKRGLIPRIKNEETKKLSLELVEFLKQKGQVGTSQRLFSAENNLLWAGRRIQKLETKTFCLRSSSAK